jgi:hypothetical protein
MCKYVVNLVVLGQTAGKMGTIELGVAQFIWIEGRVHGSEVQRRASRVAVAVLVVLGWRVGADHLQPLPQAAVWSDACRFATSKVHDRVDDLAEDAKRCWLIG